MFNMIKMLKMLAKTTVCNNSFPKQLSETKFSNVLPMKKAFAEGRKERDSTPRRPEKHTYFLNRHR